MNKIVMVIMVIFFAGTFAFADIQIVSASNVTTVSTNAAPSPVSGTAITVKKHLKKVKKAAKNAAEAITRTASAIDGKAAEKGKEIAATVTTTARTVSGAVVEKGKEVTQDK
jgi:hypothetical protein